MNRPKPFLSFITCLLLFSGCKSGKPKKETRHIERGFYYWKSVYTPNTIDNAYFDSLRIKHLHVKFFDVVWNEAKQQPAPEAVFRTTNSENALPGLLITPVVFITNQTLLQASDTSVDTLADRLLRLKNEIAAQTGFRLHNELQLDCDWTQQTKDKYFRLLIRIKHQLPVTDTLSATIRLYQLKYAQKTGVPPVDKGLLMCYNMGNLKNFRTGNSIIEVKELQQYIGSLERYPLPCDVALPLFDWWVWFSDNSYKGLLYPQQLPAIVATDNRYVFPADTIIGDTHFRKGDVLRYEDSKTQTIREAGLLVNRYLKNTRCKVLLYHFDSVILSKYSHHEIEGFFDSLR